MFYRAHPLLIEPLRHILNIDHRGLKPKPDPLMEPISDRYCSYLHPIMVYNKYYNERQRRAKTRETRLVGGSLVY